MTKYIQAFKILGLVWIAACASDNALVPLTQPPINQQNCSSAQNIPNSNPQCPSPTAQSAQATQNPLPATGQSQIPQANTGTTTSNSSLPVVAAALPANANTAAASSKETIQPAAQEPHEPPPEFKGDYKLLWKQDFDEADCFKEWQVKPNGNEIVPACEKSRLEPETSVLTIGHKKDGKGSDHYAMVWLPEPLKGHDDIKEFNIEVRMRYHAVTGWGTPAFSIGSASDPGDFSKADNREINDIYMTMHHELQYILTMAGHVYLEPKDDAFIVLDFTYTPDNKHYKVKVLRKSEEKGTMEGEGKKPHIFMIGWSFTTHEVGWWGRIEVDYVKLYGK